MIRTRWASTRGAVLAAVMIASGPGLSLPAHATRLWTWSYSGAGITASGTFSTTDTANADSFYSIVGITGTRNGETITGLQPTGTPIPGNEPYAVDNLIAVGTRQLTVDGFGYSTSSGHYASPFYADFLPTPGYLEVFSAPPFVYGADHLGPEDSELPVSFKASLVSAVPEPGTALMFGGAGLSMALWLRRRLAGAAAGSSTGSARTSFR